MVKPLHLVNDRWIPARRLSGHIGSIRPADLGERQDPVVELLWPRPDLRFACYEFLIGLLATACPPPDEEAWTEWWEEFPSPEALQSWFGSVAEAFVLDGDGPRFCQDLDPLEGEESPIERLLIDTPGDNTLRRNADLLVKRGRLESLGRPAAAMALYALQAFAPSGGAGHRTSMRGGGPLTTLVRPGRQTRLVPLWQLIWANVPCGDAPKRSELRLVFPWLASTHRSDAGGGPTVLDTKDAHRLQAFWGMPRRIRLTFRETCADERCGLTGSTDEVVVSGFRTRPGGVQYMNAAYWHPLTPTYRAKPDEPWLAVHPQLDGIGYRHWVALTAGDGRSRSSPCVTAFLQRLLPRDKARREASLIVAGYDMDNAKARGFVEAEMPLFAIESAKRQILLALARRLAGGATEVANLLRTQLRAALEIDGSACPIDASRAQFFSATSSLFWKALEEQQDKSNTPEEDEKVARDWLVILRHHAFALFDATAPLDPLAPRSAGVMDKGVWQPPPIVAARRHLGITLAGYGKGGKVLFAALDLPAPPESKSAKPSPTKSERVRPVAPSRSRRQLPETPSP